MTWAVACAAVAIWPAFVAGPVHPGERVRVVADPEPDGKPPVVAAVASLRACKHLEAFLAGRSRDVPGAPPRLPTGEPLEAIEPSARGVVLRRVESSAWNDEPECRVRLDDGRTLWVRARKLEPIRPPTPRERRAAELRRTLELRRGRR